MTSPPCLFDRATVERHRARATAEGLFLHDLARVEIEERLKDVNRAFTAPAIVSGQPGFWGDLPGIHVPDTEVLNLDPGAHDLVIHTMCLHQANDPVGQIAQSRRALKPDGLFLAVCLGGQTLSELRAALAEAEVALRGGLSPRVAPMAEIRDLGALLQRAGLALPVADLVTQNVTYDSALHLMRDLRAMGEANALKDRQRTFTSKHLFAETARIYHDTYAQEDRIPATFDLIFLSGWAPHDSQQKPLRPGSAQARLAEALKTTELGPDGKPIKGHEDN